MSRKANDDFSINQFSYYDIYLRPDAFDMDEMWENYYQNTRVRAESVDGADAFVANREWQLVRGSSIVKAIPGLFTRMGTATRNLIVKNSYIQRVFPELKVQKPGRDYYNSMVFVQVFMCIHIVLFFPGMDAEKSTIVE